MLPVQGNVYMLVADGTNITASVGPEGVALVNTGAAADVRQDPAAINQLRQTAVAPATHQYMLRCELSGGLGMVQSYMNAVISSPAPHKAHPLHRQHQCGGRSCGRQREDRRGGNWTPRWRFGGAPRRMSEGAPVVAHENVLNRMSAPAGKQAPTPQAAWPTVSYFDDFHKLPAYFNGEAVHRLLRAGGEHRRRQHRVLPSLRRHQRR